MIRSSVKITLLILALALPAVLALSLGARGYGFAEWLELLRGGGGAPGVREILLDIRLPRVLAVMLAGAMLAAAGAATQTIFRNDLASPHTLGVVSAAALGAVAGMWLGKYFNTIHLITPFALIAGCGTLILLLLPENCRRNFGSTLLLAGIAVNALTAALTSGILFLSEERLHGMVFWMLGGFWRIGWREVWLLAAFAVPGVAGLLAMSRELNVLLLGDRTARRIGVNVEWVQPLAALLAAALAAAVVSCCGVIGFVGLLVPHGARMLFGPGFKSLLGGSILLGAMLLLYADLAARLAAYPLEIPVGIITSLLGGPFFLYLLLRRR